MWKLARGRSHPPEQPHTPTPAADAALVLGACSGGNRSFLSEGGEYPSCSPDGSRIAWDNYTDVYVMRPDGPALRRLTHNRAYTPAWSPDGDHIVFSEPGLFIMDPDAGDLRALPSPGVGETSLPDWTD